MVKFNNPQYVQGTNQAGTAAGQIYPILGQQIGFAGGLQGARENSIMNLLNSYSPGNRQAQVDAFRRRANSRARESARNSALLMRSQGMGSGATEGALLDAMNRASVATNDYDASLNSPEAQAQAAQAILSATGQAIDPQLAQLLLALQGSANQYQDLLNRGVPESSGSGFAGILGTAASFLR